MMEEGTVRYIFKLEDREVVFNVDTVPVDIRSSDYKEPKDAPSWARLSYNQCSTCPLSESDCSFCPVAIKIHSLLETFADNKSTDRVTVTVETEARNYYKECDLQVGINSLMGLLMATSGCPVLQKLGAMASFHIPFCSTQETLNRSVGSYLMKQYFVRLRGGEPDWELKELQKLYDVLGVLNQEFYKRVQDSISSDAVSNAVIMFFATSVVVSSSLEHQMERHEKFLMNQK